MRKTDVLMHSEGFGRRMRPALNVKYYGSMHNDAVVEKFKCSDKTAETACGFAWESACEQFWEQAPALARDIFGSHVKVYSEGRSSGWLVVEGLPDFESWDAIILGKWAKFSKLIAADIKWRTNVEQVLDDIEANQWYKEGSEMFNMVDTEEGPRCVADMKQAAREAGFGPVVR